MQVRELSLPAASTALAQTVSSPRSAFGARQRAVTIPPSALAGSESVCSVRLFLEIVSRSVAATPLLSSALARNATIAPARPDAASAWTTGAV